MPCASAPKAPWVEVWLSPQTMVVPGGVRPAPAHDVATPCARQARRHIRPELARSGQFLDLLAALWLSIPPLRQWSGYLWSTTASVLCGAHFAPDSRKPSKTYGLVTSWTR
jgi:hypothetical protein